MDEALPAGGRLGREGVGRERRDDSRGQPQRTDELPGRLPRVDVDAVDREDCLHCTESLVLKLAERGAVDRVRELRAEAIYVEQGCALADLLVWREGNPQRRTRQLRMRGEVRHRGHDRGDAGLVVSAEQRVAARADDLVADL